MVQSEQASRVGQTLKEKYELGELLGEGGMGEVYRARNVLVDRTVAIKILRTEFAANPQVVERFLREAKAANVVRHRNIVDVLDIDKTDDGVMFIVQEYLEGEDLATRLQDLGAGLSVDEALDVLIPVAEAVGVAHQRGVVHRDLKPDNVFLALEEDEVVPKVLDFGISKVPLQAAERRTALGVGPAPKNVRLTVAGMAVGTPSYMSPEQIRDPSTVDARGDVWSLGVMLYETLSGRLPFEAADLGGLFAEICTREPLPLGRLVPAVPRSLVQIVERCLRPERAERFADAANLAVALRRCREQMFAGDASRIPPVSSRPGVTMVSGPPPAPDGGSLGLGPTLPGRPGAVAIIRDTKGPEPAPEPLELELDMPKPTPPRTAEPAAQRETKGAGAVVAGASAAAEPSAARAPASAGSSPFGVFDDDEGDEPVAGLSLELADDPLPGAPSAGARPRAARVVDRSVPPADRRRAVAGASRRERAGDRQQGGRRVRLMGRPKLGGPSKAGELVRLTLAALLTASFGVAVPYAAPAQLVVLHQKLGVLAYVPFVCAAGVLVAAAIGFTLHAARWSYLSLLLAALATLVLAIGGGITGAVLAAPGLVGSTTRMVSVLAVPWAAVVASVGFALFGLGRARQLWGSTQLRWLGISFAASALIAVGAVVWIVRGPLPGVADAAQMKLVPAETLTRAQVRRFAVVVAGARALGGEPRVPVLRTSRSGGAVAAALQPLQSP